VHTIAAASVARDAGGMVLASDYPFLEIAGTMLLFFLWLIWVWTLVAILSDIFRRHDLSGWGKAGWTLFTIVLPFLGVLIYLIAHGQEMGERRYRDAEARFTRDATGGVSKNGGPAAEIAQAKRLMDEGVIDGAEFAELKRQALAA